MDLPQMSLRCPSARPRGAARLGGYRFLINQAGVATVVAQPGGDVFGLLWDLVQADLDRLDRYEGIDRGTYRRGRCTIEAMGSSQQALIYVAADAQPGMARPGYMAGVLAAARSLRLPDAYLDELASWT
jgi:gamma-glutamylcyclotransferase (GGCT)/AIG2-like uncharacterized protein YtfP